MFGIPLSFVIICIVVSAWCSLHNHLHGRYTPKVRAFNVVLEIILLIYAAWSFGILMAVAIAIAFTIVSALFSILWRVLGLRKI
jgi:hypothetical protein